MLSPLALWPTVVFAQQTPAAQPPSVQERVEVVATRIPEPAAEVPAPIEVFTAQELTDRGARDLQSALALATGVVIAPGGDGGPASSVPEFWGLREFDAFLLVVDGVPWGGAFNPALATLSLTDVARIEVMRGPAPVTYGATSFVGVIHVVHKPASESSRAISARAGSFGSGGVVAALPFSFGGFDSRLTADVDRQGFKDDRTSFTRAHALWRNTRNLRNGHFWFNVDATWLDQNPASPHPRAGQSLSSLVPLDANQNPDGAFLSEKRAAFMTGFDRKVGSAHWTLTGSFSRSAQDILRGFLNTLEDTEDNATGFREQIDVTDVYVDTHLAWTLSPTTRFIAGGDYMLGLGDARGADFDYESPLSGVPIPQAVVPTDLDVRIEDHRNFAGGYGLVEWHPTSRVRVDAGLRLNVTNEVRDGGKGEEEADGGEEHGETHVRLSGSAGVMFDAWSRGSDSVRLYANYRDTFKPAAFDFGLGEAEGGEEGEEGEGLLEPETARSVEGGMKSRWMDGRLGIDVSAFLMRFKNLVVPQSVNGLPALTNAGTERFAGLETGASMQFAKDITGRATYSFHDATFDDYLTEFDGVPTQLAGRRIEMSARHLASAGVVRAPARGVLAGIEVGYVGSRYLNKRNTALADGYGTLGVMAGWRTPRWEVRFDGRNLTDERPPIAESELGESSYYRLPARSIDVSFTTRF
jgi:iron complex outermembrane receptor protein